MIVCLFENYMVKAELNESFKNTLTGTVASKRFWKVSLVSDALVVYPRRVADKVLDTLLPPQCRCDSLQDWVKWYYLDWIRALLLSSVRVPISF